MFPVAKCLAVMKFGKRLLREAHVDWTRWYLQYNQLKKLLKQTGTAPEEGSQEFEHLLSIELHKINCFYEQQMAVLVTNFQKIQASNSTQATIKKFCDDLDIFRRYVVLNYIGVYKIVKKRNKIYKALAKIDHVDILKRQLFYISDQLGKLYVSTRVFADTLSPSSSTAIENYTCPICLDTLVNPVVLSCTHNFCWNCLCRVAEDMQACPVCRKEQELDPNSFVVDTTLSEFIIRTFAPDLSEERLPAKLSPTKRLRTTTIGSYPKPEYLRIPDWFKERPDTATLSFSTTKHDDPELVEHTFKATCWCVDHQCEMGIDIVTDGDMDMDNYIYGFCRTLQGIDFSNLKLVKIRKGAGEMVCPTVSNKVLLRCPGAWAARWKRNSWISTYDHPLKVTIPGPMTCADTLNNEFYDSKQELMKDIAAAIRSEIAHLVEAGCKYIQIDEPLWCRFPEDAIEFGISIVDDMLKEVPVDVFTAVHACCGYPEYLDHTDYVKADRSAYTKLAPFVDQARHIHSISIEDAHCHNDLSELLPLFKRTTVILGVVAVAKSEVESVKTIRERIRYALKFIDRESLMIAPDCGLGFLPPAILTQKLSNMCAAVKMI